MERVNFDLWRVVFNPRPALLEQALFVRDATGLPVECNSEIPPRLRDDVPDHSSYFSPHWRALAGVRWTSWWHALVRYGTADQLVSLEFDSASTPRRQHGGGDSRSAPPPFPRVDQEPSSTAAIDRVLELAAQWSSSRRTILLRTRPPSLVTPLEHERISSIASETAARLGVPLGTMRAVVQTLSVSGEWSSRPLAGVLLCSESVLENESLFASLLADTFISGLDRQPIADPAGLSTQRPALRSVLDSPLLIADAGEMTLRLEGVYSSTGGFELELSRSGESTGPSPRPYPRGQGQSIDPQGFLDHFSGLEVDVRVESESLDEDNSPQGPANSAAVNRFWRPGRGPNTLWLWVGVDSPRGYVMITTTWPECQIHQRTVKFELRQSDTDA